MVKKRRFWLYIVIAIAVIITGILLYIFLKGKSQASSNTGESGTTEVPSNNGNLSVIEQIKNFFSGGSSAGGSSGGRSGGGGSGGGGGGGGGGSGTTTTPEFSTDKTICQNAQDSSLCDGLDITYGEGYKALCCSEHSLCC